jgi:hypothetical protein
VFCASHENVAVDDRPWALDDAPLGRLTVNW